jgi:hypothetical protein
MAWVHRAAIRANGTDRDATGNQPAHHIEKASKRLSAKNITEACVQAVRYKFFT